MRFRDGYAHMHRGGALLIDLSKTPRRSRASIVRALVGALTEIAAADLATGSSQAPFIFFDDAQPLVPRDFLADVLMPATALGLRSFFVTTMVGRLEDVLLRQADNLFLQHVTSEDDIRRLAGPNLIDVDTLRAFGRLLQESHSLLIGKASGGYPIIFAVSSPSGVDMSRALSDSSHSPAQVPTERQPSPQPSPNLPLFPDESAARPTGQEPGAERRNCQTSSLPRPTIPQVTAMWDHVVRRVARRRRILETILAVARPLRIAEQTLVLGFPPQHRFQQELVESEEYRSLLQEELNQTFGVNFDVTTEVYPV